MKMSLKKVIKMTVLVLAGILLLCSCSKENEIKEETESKEPEEDRKEELVKTLEFNGKQMSYIRFGNPEGKPFVILPGLSLKSVMGSAEAIAAAYDLMAKEHDVYLFDHIKEVKEGYSVEGMADDTFKAFELLGIKNANVMGVSMGSMVAQTMALKSPESVASLVLCSPTSDVKNSDQTTLQTWRSLAEKEDVASLMESFGEMVYSPAFYEKYKDIIIAGGEGTSKQDLSNFIHLIDAIKEFDVHERLNEIKCPVFVLGAGEDKVLGADAALAIAEKLQCEYYIYEGYGHGVYDEAPDYLSRIKAFLDK